jgi:capsular polysaccharide transport system permease protein
VRPGFGAEDTEINVYQEHTMKRSMAALRTHRLSSVNGLFLLTVVIPTALAILYFGFIASDIYVSESRFVVQSPDKPTASGLGFLLKSAAGFSSAGDEIYAADEYIQSRDALRALNRNGAVVSAYGNNRISIFDRFDALGFGGSFEDLFDYFRKKVHVDYETTSGITALTVRAYRAEDAQRFNLQLLQLAEDTVNRLNRRGRTDVVQLSEQEVQDSEEAARQAALALAQFRNASGIIDPEKQAAVQLQMISKLQDELIGSRTQLLQLRAMAPENPQIPILQVRISGLAREIDRQLGLVAGNRQSLSATAARYQRLQLEREFADKRLAAAMTSLQDARSESRRKQAYVERIAQPSLPDKAEEPRRLRGIFATLVLGMIAWAILSMLRAGVREHHG